MDQIKQDIPAGFWMDSKGRMVPEAMVNEVDKLEDQLVKKMSAYADELSAQIARFKGHCFDDVGAFMSLIAEKYRAGRGGAKGNVTFSTYDGCLKVQIAVADHLSFGPQLQVAKTLVDECIAEWAEDARSEIRVLVEHAFRTDREGQVSREAIFALRRVNIQDPRWQSAMEAISDSIRVVGSKTYIRFYRRETPQSPWVPVTIDLAAA
jgi:hypothetical protein